MLVVVAGASGLLGTALTDSLRADGHEVRRLVRRAARSGDEVGWDPAAGRLDPAALAGADAVVNLSGAGIGDKRWTGEYQQVLRDSRLEPTDLLARTIAESERRPATYVCASAVGFYGDTGEAAVDESAVAGSGFLARLVADWEAAAAPAAAAGVRVVTLRTGIVLTRRGGALAQLLPLFSVGLGGRLGSGRQWMSWITLADHVRATRHLLEDAGVAGPVNLTAPQPVRNAEFTAALARALRRPAALAVPALALRVRFGGFADEGLLVSQRVLPARLTAAGFDFTHPDLDAALAAVL